ncbi:response regulator [Lutimonas halocynthiae]|uniref:response regulator n=1 Tax=Lutimonas halocynthiae TaxID=1446477 RepID=UPI0025B47F00|nr:response regulator [Lutimonas halocynthiae]MDN3643084.1 response regulator [Lutimonas halocynthiae]
MKIGQQVFVVDDDLSARIGLTRLLNAAGFNVRFFAGFNEFLKLIKTEKYGCILLDPLISGFETTELKEKLSKSDQNLVVIFITSDYNEETRMKARELNAVGFFNKPVDGLALIDAIKWAMVRKGNI